MLANLIIALLNLSASVICSDNYSREDFPPGFVFGSGTSAYQVEGAANEDGRSPSIWDTFVHNGFMHGETGDVAMNQYHKYKEDVQLMVETGLDAYRFSISWSRLIPNGRGPVNPQGLQYYNNLINELISHGIQPHVTLCHYDHPQALEDEYGGWVSRKIVKDFTDYAAVCFREYGDRVSHWTTVNEPNSFPLGSYDLGILPPHHCSPPFGFNCTKGNSSTEPYLVAHHILLAHASAVRLYRKNYQMINTATIVQGKQHGFIGINLYAPAVLPQTNSTEDVLATQRFNDFIVGLLMNPLVFGDYPEAVKKIVGLRLPAFTKYESKQVMGSFDFLGLNHYHPIYVRDNSAAASKLENRDYKTDMGAEWISQLQNSTVYEFPTRPWDLQLLLEQWKQVYGNIPIYVHENGQRTKRNSSTEDTARVKYIHAYIGGLLDAVRNGLNARGYFTWSFLDVFELLDGYDSSFGLYYVDIDDPEFKRYPKLSAHWYSHLLKGGNVSSDQVMQLARNFTFFSNNHYYQ